MSLYDHATVADELASLTEYLHEIKAYGRYVFFSSVKECPFTFMLDMKPNDDQPEAAHVCYYQNLLLNAIRQVFLMKIEERQPGLITRSPYHDEAQAAKAH